jgi:hypothetical protein
VAVAFVVTDVFSACENVYKDLLFAGEVLLSELELVTSG